MTTAGKRQNGAGRTSSRRRLTTKPRFDEVVSEGVFSQRLQVAVNRSTDTAAFRTQVFEAVSEEETVAAAAWAEVSADGVRLLEHNLTGPVFERDEIAAWLTDSIRNCFESQTGKVESTPLVRNLRMHVQPIPFRHSRSVDAVTVFLMLVSDTRPFDSVQLTVELIASSASCWSLLQETSTANHEVSLLAALVELGSRASDCESTRTYADITAGTLCQVTGCDVAAVGLASRQQGPVKILGVSGHSDFDNRALIIEQLSRVLEETTARDRLTSWPPVSEAERFLTKAHQSILRSGGVECALSTPLRDDSGEAIGAIVLLGKPDRLMSPTSHGLMDALSAPVGRHFAAVRKREGSRPVRLLRSAVRFAASIKMVVLLIATGLIAAAMFLPVPHHIWCDVTFQPVERRYSVAPHDGLLETTLAEPGDVVTKGQLLATMDGREIRWELAGTTAGRQKAEREKDAFMADYRMPQAVIAGLEMERMQHELNVLAFRESNLSVTSPIDGVVLDGSLDRRENYPVSSGDVIYEIAPLSFLLRITK